MSAEIALVIPWFGKFPSSMPLWLNSCQYNQEFDFLLFTDDHSELDFPANVKLVYLSFSEFPSQNSARSFRKIFPFLFLWSVPISAATSVRRMAKFSLNI